MRGVTTLLSGSEESNCLMQRVLVARPKRFNLLTLWLAINEVNLAGCDLFCPYELLPAIQVTSREVWP
jgi:hypothetical protein